LAPASDGRPPESPAQQKADAAIHEQKELLAEFSKVSDQLGEILGSLEASTFVKRLKAASREQLGIAKDITTKTLGAFGIEREVLPEAESVVKKAKAQSEVVRVIQSDLDAYAQRNQDRRLKRLLEEMKRSEVIRALARDGEMVSLNLSGQSLSLTEFWADTLDRWAEELVAASKGKASEGGEEGGDSLPPEVVLKVMSALRDEMYLRDETREVESSKAAVPEERFVSEAKRLAAKQAGVLQKTQSAVEEIEAIQDGALKFAKEVGLLRSVAKVMNEAGEILAAPDTGGRAVAAETEAIELLLQAKRSASKGSGGGGTSPGEGGRADKASSTALSDLGPGTDAGSGVAARPVGQATGRAGREFPEEFKAGLDSYFNLLEGTKR
jgi:CTP-dependent riboflavin kinase